MKVIKTRLADAGKITLVYNLVQDGDAYGLEIKAPCEKYPYIYVDDVAREVNKALEILELFADNAVFPQNALEIFDDMLGIVL